MFSRISWCLGATVLTLIPLAHAQSDSTADERAVERITIQGTFRSMAINEAPTSVSALNAEQLEQRAALHLEDALNALPNVNFSAGSSRARFIQIRGIGERSQFVDPINPSVGLLIDGIQYSGLGQAAQLFDISQVEVYRGPQSGRFGADGLAGMLVLESTRPSSEGGGVWQLGAGNYGLRQGGLAVGGGLGALGSARFSVFQNRDDGFTENTFLGRDDTQQRSERMARLNVFSDIGQNWQLRTTLHAYRQDNGYDAFSLDNTRQTLSDQPGEDDLSLRAARLAASYSGWQGSELQLASSWLSADSTYSFDEDWSFEGIAPGWEYVSFDQYLRERSDRTFEARWLSTVPSQWFGVPTDWLVGFYHYARDEQLQRGSFASDYDNRHNAIYGELELQLDRHWQFTLGGRVEHYRNPYSDNNTVQARPSDTMWGGRASLSYLADNGALWYATLARGYKTGGVNGEAIGRAIDKQLPDVTDFLQTRTTFAPELLSSIEVGYKWANAEQTQQLTVAAFAQYRDDVQLKGWINEQQTFVGYIENAASGRVNGLELEWRQQLNQQWLWFASLGLLDSEMQGYITQDGMDMSGRELAHAPSYTLNTGLQWQVSEALLFSIQADGKDRFYYSDSHNSQSQAITLLHASLAWQLADWQIDLWARNLTDRDYGVRGFFFGNDPRIEYASRTYEQFGEPRRFGVTFRHQF
ncbi:MAG: Pesticin receptor [Pseudidiomarina mangrovi]|nr:MAG: Pesticin receptor [Pseudidiomarina mangrovi]